MAYAKTMLTLCIQETPKSALLQTVKTHMKAAFHQGLHCLLRVIISLDKTFWKI